jgi:hypothetical protein
MCILELKLGLFKFVSVLVDCGIMSHSWVGLNLFFGFLHPCPCYLILL